MAPIGAQLAEDLAPEDFRRVLAVFRDDVARLCQVLLVAARAGDPTTFRRAAHSLAGAAGAVGAEALEQACRVAMTRHDILPAQFPATASAIERLGLAALRELAALLEGIEHAA
ncbi:MAG: Hpt domain-containing protein [Rhodospirillales bacterium]|nr:Hpt domain-containing protein [Rhodospirillales bacterium]MDE2197838.1 Hpt domain-containing protein [Rhodospirillales bacterium]MDE2574619.1 Hpt domain-containing protein [Rhodospirillales bacterium]